MKKTKKAKASSIPKKRTGCSEPLQRQAIATSPKQLRKLADSLEKEYQELEIGTGFRLPLGKRCLVPIVNHSDASDTWEFENG